jgi:Circadian oscillating protein COP23
MKLHKSLLLFSTAGVIALSANPSFSQSNSSDSLSFRCRDINGIPTTEVYNSKNPEKNLPLIHWKSDLIDSQNIQEDCKNAASKLQKRGDVNFTAISPNTNSQYVVCLIDAPGETCDVSDDKLLRLKPTKEARTALSKILDENFVPLKNLERFKAEGYSSPKIKRNRWSSFLLGIIKPRN